MSTFNYCADCCTHILRAWSIEGVETVRNTTGADGLMRVDCSSSHLTAFAVLVDVSGTISVRWVSDIHAV